MKKRFNCPNCSAVLQADESLAGRTIRCPKCKHELTIPTFEAAVPEAFPLPTPEELLDRAEDSSDATDVRAPQETALLGTREAESADPNEDFELASEVGVVEERRVPDGPASDDPMLKLFPDFVPNPFQRSYPLDKTPDDVEEAQEEEPAVESKMPSVDELIE